MRTTMNLPMVHRRWKGDHAHAAAMGKCRCRCVNHFVVSQTAKEGEDLCGKRSLHVRNDDEGVAPSTRNCTKWVVAQGCWTTAPGGGGKNDCLNRSVYGSGSCFCLNLLVGLLVAARVARWEMGSRRPGKAR